MNYKPIEIWFSIPCSGLPLLNNILKNAFRKADTLELEKHVMYAYDADYILNEVFAKHIQLSPRELKSTTSSAVPASGASLSASIPIWLSNNRDLESSAILQSIVGSKLPECEPGCEESTGHNKTQRRFWKKKLLRTKGAKDRGGSSWPPLHFAPLLQVLRYRWRLRLLTKSGYLISKSFTSGNCHVPTHSFNAFFSERKKFEIWAKLHIGILTIWTGLWLIQGLN
jgi:hypothetical protein